METCIFCRYLFVFRFDQQVENPLFDVTMTNPIYPNDPVVISDVASPVPEPATILLMAAGLGGLGFARLRRGKER